MPFDLVAIYLKLPVFALIASRLGGLIMFQPVLGALSIPFTLRALFVLSLAALITPLVDLPPQIPATLGGLAIAMAGELLLGVLLGMISAACFYGLQLAGLLVAQESGLAFGQLIDPTSDEEETIAGVFYLQFAVVVMLAVGGHRALLSACLDTFQSVPLLAAALPAGLPAALPADLAAALPAGRGSEIAPAIVPGTDVLVQALALSFEIAVRVAAPTLLALLLVNVALGFISRTLPQLNVLMVGFSLKSLLAFALMAISLPTAADAFISGLERVNEWLGELL